MTRASVRHVTSAAACAAALVSSGPVAAAAPNQPSTAVAAQDPTHFRPGIWEVHHQTNGLPWPSHKICLDKLPITRLFDQGPATEIPCQDAHRDIRAVASGYLIDGACVAHGEQVETHAQLTGDLETNYLLQTTIRAAGQTLNFREAGEWLGACPSGVKLGEWVDAPQSDNLAR